MKQNLIPNLQAHAKRARWALWRELFDNMQAKGMVVYLVLEDDSAWKGHDEGRPEENHHAWRNPRNGKDGTFQNESPLAGGRQTLLPPGSGNWAVRLALSAGSAGK